MRVLLKTLGWLFVSGLIIFGSNLSAGVPWLSALYGAAIAKIGTTIAYFFYEHAFERAVKRQTTATDRMQDNEVDWRATTVILPIR